MLNKVVNWQRCVTFSNARYGDVSWRGHNHRHQMCYPNYRVIGDSSLVSNYNDPRLIISSQIRQASNSSFSIPETLDRADLSVGDQIRFRNSSTSGPSITRLRAPAREVQKRKNPDHQSNGMLDLDLSLGAKAKADTKDHEEDGNDGAIVSNLCLCLNSSSNPPSDKITRLRGIAEYGKEEEEEEVLRTEKTSATLDLTL